MIIVVTGMVGIDKKPYLAEVCESAKKRGLINYEDIDWESVSHHSNYSFFAHNISREDYARLRKEIIKTADCYNTRMTKVFWKDKINLLIKDPIFFAGRTAHYAKVFFKRLVYRMLNKRR